MTVLTATSGRIKTARKLADRRFRRLSGEFLIEGPQLLAEALAAGADVRRVFATAAAIERHPALVEASPVPWETADERALRSLSDTVSPTGLVAVCGSTGLLRELDRALPEDASQVVICADVRDPGNAGTVIRCADAVGADAVVMAGQCVDPLNPKTVRATVGSLFHLPIVEAEDVAATVAALQGHGFVVLAAEGGGEESLFELDGVMTGKVAWLFGNEAWGLPAQTAALADHRVRIPILGRAESLNLATAAAVALYATARARHSVTVGSAVSTSGADRVEE